ncbi:prolyl oligopeptidase family serine peptidase [Qipengyuania vesicularis]|uniref:prolyl oligopeptidase family serine peptidase n=1 Tax=Qipengyuania vesicularis TaxID=2867232 RepID=UPI001C874F08|nr:prolyl oligopeptidase family serine peptidase [Qipengyuania vesicularis]MBX7527317.1 prolyl oligopeptidase family serine peptidase [Qipengyuania vesicularis]
MKLVSTAALGAALAFSMTTNTMAQDGVPGPDEDPYIWLEEARSEEALDWVRAENNRTMAHMAQDPRFDELTAEALAILDAEDRVPYVSIRKDGLYNFWQDKQNPKGVLRRTTLESYRTDNPEWDIILDVDALAEAEGKEWVYKGSTCLPPDQRLCMIALSDGGEDATILREFDMVAKQFVEGGFVIEEKSQGGIEWLDEDTLLVGRDFGGNTITESEYPFTTRLWQRGTPLAEAEEIFRGEQSDVWAGAGLIRDNKGVVHGRTAYRAISFHEAINYVWHKGEWVELDMPKKANIGGIIDGQLTFSTDVDWETQGQVFPADALVAVDLEEFKRDPNGAKKTLVWAPGERQTKQGGGTTADSAYMAILDNVVGKVLKIDFEDDKWVTSEVALPDNATLSVATTSSETGEIMFSSTDFLNPSTLWYSDGTSEPEVLKTSPAYFDASGMEVVQLEATSKDGAKIPYFLVKPQGMEMDGTTPTLLYGYGGFQVSQLPGYRALTGKMWLEKGGAFILANLRGGGEFGPGWHQTAIRENKQRTWDDFIAVGRDAVERGITNPGQLGIQGGSQGGLLVGTAFTQAPELFDAAIVAIPLFDMLRYHLIGRGASWIGEYGDPRIPEQRAWIEGYSPYQKIVEGVDYPAPFLWASTADDRTHPAHARKGAARLKELGQEYWYFEDMTGGHSGGVDNEQRAKLQALQMVYLMQRLMDHNEGE